VLLEGRNAVIYGGGGAIGGAAARAFAREGARVFLAGRHQASLERVAADIRGAGGTAETADTAVRTTFLTSRAAGRLMVRQGSGVILAFGGSGDPPRDHHLGGLQVAFEAIEAMRRQLSAELGRHGVRFVTLRSGGVPETIPPGVDGRDAIVEDIERQTMLGRAATLEDVGNVAAFAASDRARTMTAATANVSCGALVD
jgi:3-oxoacyl-[acyl-carrier protein] reductase